MKLTKLLNLYLDRFEGNFAVLLIDQTQINLPRKLLPEEASPGDFLSLDIRIDENKKRMSASEITRLKKHLNGSEG